MVSSQGKGQWERKSWQGILLEIWSTMPVGQNVFYVWKLNIGFPEHLSCRIIAHVQTVYLRGFKASIFPWIDHTATGWLDPKGNPWECSTCMRTKNENSRFAMIWGWTFRLHVAMVMIHSNRRWEKENIKLAYLQERLSMLVYDMGFCIQEIHKRLITQNHLAFPGCWFNTYDLQQQTPDVSLRKPSYTSHQVLVSNPPLLTYILSPSWLDLVTPAASSSSGQQEGIENRVAWLLQLWSSIAAHNTRNSSEFTQRKI